MLFFIKRQLKSKDYKTRKEGIEALGKRKGSTVAVQLAGDLANSEEAAEVLSGIGKLNPNGVKTLAEALSRGDWVLKTAAAIVLGQGRQVSALTPLLEAATAKGPNWWAIPAVAEALGELGNAEAIEALRSLLDQASVRQKSYQQDEKRDLPDYARREIQNALKNSKLAITVIERSLGKLGATVKPSGG